MNHEQKSKLSPISQEQQSPDTQLTEKEERMPEYTHTSLNPDSQNQKRNAAAFLFLMFLYFFINHDIETNGGKYNEHSE